MAMAHPNPGLGSNKVTRHQKYLRVVSAPPDISSLRKMLKPVEAENINDIKNCAWNKWNMELAHNEQSMTTYSGLHSQKQLDQPTQCRVRPSSPTRLNKPHPKEVFLVTRLKKLKGCYEPDKARLHSDKGGKKRVQNYVRANKSSIDIASTNQIEAAPKLRRPKTAHGISNQARLKIRTVMGNVPAQATEAWIKLSNNEGKAQIMTAVNGQQTVPSPKPQYLRRQDYALDRRMQYPSLRKSLSPKKQQNVVSSTRWMKKAGCEESLTVRKLLESLQNAPKQVLPMQGPHFHITDYSSMFTKPKPPYYDFQIHPEWHQPWHKQYVKSVTA